MKSLKPLVILITALALSLSSMPKTVAVATNELIYTETTQSNKGHISELNGYPNTHVNTGDKIYDLIEVAMSQVGYYRPEGETKYGKWYGYPNDAWCAMFISWCAKEADISTDIIKKFCRCSKEAEWFMTINRWKEPGEHTPQAGDIIFFDNDIRINHVGIVTGSKDGYVYCIEGNHANSVNVTRHSLTDDKITGYGVPDYTGEGYADIKYSLHVQGHGWLDWSGNGEPAGTTGESRRAEAIEIKLTGELAEKYDVQYRVHVQGHGWLDWVCNGETAGTTGESRRMEAIEIVLIEK